MRLLTTFRGWSVYAFTRLLETIFVQYSHERVDVRLHLSHVLRCIEYKALNILTVAARLVTDILHFSPILGRAVRKLILYRLPT